MLAEGFTFSTWVRRSSNKVGEVFNNNQFILRVQPENENTANPFEAFVRLSDVSRLWAVGFPSGPVPL
jgi:hypothetical protein